MVAAFAALVAMNAGITWGTYDIAYALGNALYEINDDGAGRRLVARGFDHPDVRWSPDGMKFLVASGNDAWTMNVDGTHRRRVLHTRAIVGIAWRPALRGYATASASAALRRRSTCSPRTSSSHTRFVTNSATMGSTQTRTRYAQS